MTSGIQPSTPPPEHGVPSAGHDLLLRRARRSRAVRQFEAIMQRHGGELLPVFLHCSREEAIAEGRQSRPGRAAKKWRQRRVGKYLDRNNFTAGRGRLPEAGYRR
jgi:hypothetical protein